MDGVGGTDLNDEGAGGADSADKCETPYDKHWGYRDDLLDVGPRFFMRTGLMLRMLRDEVDADGRPELLDVGCGDGVFIAKCLELGYAVTGMDLSKAAVDRCRERLGDRVRLFCCDIDAIVGEGPFDAVTAGEVLEHIEDDEDFIRKVFALLKPGGVFVLTVPVDQRLWSGADAAAGHFRRYTVEEIGEKLRRAGFAVERRVVWGWPITRRMHFKIREEQNKLMGAGSEGKTAGEGVDGEASEAVRQKARLMKAKPLLRLAKYVFLIDNLFNWTGRGVGVVVKARRLH